MNKDGGAPMIGDLWSIRMRASKSVRNQESGVRSQNPESRIQNPEEVHISGAEGLYTRSEINRVIKEYTKRAFDHPRGLPDSVVITVEKIRRGPAIVSLLPVSTIRSASPEEAKKIIKKLLIASGITNKAVQDSLKVINSKTVISGAALISSSSGVRLEPDKQRGVRVSRLGITKKTENQLSTKLAGEGLNTTTVKEAIVLASKVASGKGIIAELCVSDDPDYTTGYIASKNLGYVRIPNIKRPGSPHGGRVFFVGPEVNISNIITYLEKTAVIAVE